MRPYTFQWDYWGLKITIGKYHSMLNTIHMWVY